MSEQPATTRRISRTMSWVLAVVCTVVGLAVVVFGAVLHRRAEATRSWPTVDGVVLESGVARERAADGELRSNVAGEVVYTYVVENTTYVGDRITWFPYATNDMGITRELEGAVSGRRGRSGPSRSRRPGFVGARAGRWLGAVVPDRRGRRARVDRRRRRASVAATRERVSHSGRSPRRLFGLAIHPRPQRLSASPR